MLYRILRLYTLLFVFVAFDPNSAAAQQSEGCYQCNEDTQECNFDDGQYHESGCLADGGEIEVCQGGVCSSDCVEDEGSCKIIYTLLEPFGITPDHRITFQTADLRLASVLPVPGRPGLYADWTCGGEIIALYRRTGIGTFEAQALEPIYLTLTQ